MGVQAVHCCARCLFSNPHLPVITFDLTALFCFKAQMLESFSISAI